MAGIDIDSIDTLHDMSGALQRFRASSSGLAERVSRSAGESVERFRASRVIGEKLVADVMEVADDLHVDIHFA